jgi:hypothetical protein
MHLDSYSRCIGPVDTLTGEVDIDYPIVGKDLTLGIAIDNSMVAAYNTANGTTYSTAPDG